MKLKKQAFVIDQTETGNFWNWWNLKSFVIDASQGESSALRGKFIGQLPWKPNPQKPGPCINNRLKIQKCHFGFYDFHQTRFLKLLAFMSSIRPIFWSRPLASSVLLFFRPTARARNRQRIVCRNELLGQEPHPSWQIYIGDYPRKEAVPHEQCLDFVALKTHSSALLVQIPDHHRTHTSIDFLQSIPLNRMNGKAMLSKFFSSILILICIFFFWGICEKFIKECIGQGKVHYDPNLHELVARGKCETLNANLVMSIW